MKYNVGKIELKENPYTSGTLGKIEDTFYRIIGGNNPVRNALIVAAVGGPLALGDIEGEIDKRREKVQSKRNKETEEVLEGSGTGTFEPENFTSKEKLFEDEE